MTHTDIRKNSFIERLPETMRPYAYLMRLDRPIGTWLLLLPGWWAIMLATGGVFQVRDYEFMLFVLFGVGAIVMRGAGCVINDLWDRRLDQEVERTAARPLAAGVVGVRQALLFTGALLLVGFLILLQMPLVTILLGFLSLPLIVIYPLMKRYTWWPQAFLGIIFNFGVLMGWSAVAGIISVPTLLLYAGCFFWTLGYDTVYARQDIEDDMRVGIKSSARVLGNDCKTFVGSVYGVSFAFIALAFIIAGAGILSYMLLALPAFHLYWQLKRWNIDDHASSLFIFRSNRDYGLLVFLAAAL